MRYKLIKDINPNYRAIEQVLTNRGIDFNDIHHYLNTTDADIAPAEMLGEGNLKAAASALIQSINNNAHVLVVVDCDCDGYTSSAILINYLFDLFPTWAEKYLHWYLHDDKTHGLSDVMDCVYDAYPEWPALVICPDSSSNDYEYHKELAEHEIKVVVLDHHEADHISENAIIINNQLSDYPNKAFSGAGIVWQFCRYLDKLLNIELSSQYKDLVALGNCGDMMSLRSLETKHVIVNGFREENLKNPFIYGMADKNSYSLGNKITPMGAAFYIVPFVNSMVRSGTLEEKELLFNSMLKHKAFEEILSNKRGHKPGEVEKLVEQALRTAVNVKSRQTRAQDAGMELIEKQIEEFNMMEHKVLMFLLQPGQIDGNIAGLIANKIMAKYQRPVLMLTLHDGLYAGSARGYSKSGIENFKDICQGTGLTEYAEGHQNAFGLGILPENVDEFLRLTDIALKDLQSEPLYYVDYIFKGVDVKAETILDIASLSDLWGQDIDESLICIENIKITKSMVTLMSPDKKPTLKITLPNKISLIKFGSSQEEYESLLTEGYLEMNIIGKCNANEWMGNITPQVLIEDFEIIGQSKYNF